MEYAEITRELFVMITEDVVCSKVINQELCNRYYYDTKGVRLQQIDNFVSCVSQYYIRDINA